MNYPLISEYIEAIKAAEANFEELTNLRAVLGEDGQPVMNAGGFSVVFKMEDKETGKYYALKCFTKEQKGRAEAYHQIAEELKDVDSPYLISIRYLDKELFVDTNQTSETEFPVLLMDWIDGKPLDKYLRKNLKKKKTLEKFLSNFYQLAKWLIAQPFAHGDLKPDNILVKKDGNLVLVDYDGMYVPAMSGRKSREMGSPDFCHPQRNEDTFDEHIDDFSILSILLSLCVFFVKPSFWGKYGAEDRLLFSKNDYVDICKSNAFRSIPSIIETSTNYKSLFEKACKDLNFQLKMKSLTPINKLFTAITLQEESKEKLKKGTETRTVNDIEVTFCAIRAGIDDIANAYDYRRWNHRTKVHNDTDIEEYQRKILEQKKSLKATKWQAALLINITIILLVIFDIVNSRGSEILPAVGWGLCLGLPTWYFCFFDYIKRDGSYGNCFFAFVLFPITIYYGIYSCICMCINYFKEWRNKA